MKRWFDKNSGDVLSDAQAKSLEGVQDVDLVFLPDVVNAAEFPYEEGRYEPHVHDGWAERDFVRLGRWALGIVNYNIAPEEQRPLATRHIARLAIFGIFPTIAAIDHRFGTLADFRRRIGSPGGTDRTRYARWGEDDFIRYAKKYTDPTGPPLSEPDFDELNRQGKGPSGTMIRRRMGIRQLNDCLGYPDVKSWERDDYIDWGVRVMLANPDFGINLYILEILSHRRRGPSHKPISANCGSWSEFKCAVEQQFEHRIGVYQKMLEAGELPEEFATSIANRDYKVAARFRVAQYCLPRASHQRLMSIAQSDETLTSLIVQSRPRFERGDVEVAAIILGVFDEASPGREDYKTYMHVTKEELDAIRAAEIPRRNKYRQRTVSF